MHPDHRNELAAAFARIDQPIARGEDATAILPDDDPDRARVEFCLSEPRLD